MKIPGAIRRNRSGGNRGVALIAVLLLLMVASAVAVALMYTVNTEQHLQGNDQGNGLAYYGAEAGMEKMMSDLGDFFLNPPQPSPTAAQIQSVACAPNTSCSNAPDPFSLNGTTFSDYEIIVPLAPNGVDPNYQPRTISAGANAGLLATILPLTLRASADRPGGEQVKMERNVEVALIPVFQFGVLSQSDLSYFAGGNFQFPGRVHTNGNLFLAAGNNGTLSFLGQVRAVNDIVRDTLANGVKLANDPGNHTGNVYLPTGTGGCDNFVPGNPPATCRALSYTNPNEGSSINGTLQPPGIPTAGGAANANWSSLSRAVYNGMVLNGLTGASPLHLPFVKANPPPPPPAPQPIEIIRRPQPTDSAALAQSRLFNKAQIRVLLNDDPAELSAQGAADAQNVRLANWGAGAFGNGADVPGPAGTVHDDFAAGDNSNDNDLTGKGYIFNGAVAPHLIDGYLRVEVLTNGGWVGVTDQWLNLGWARQQQIPDSEVHADGTGGVGNTINPSAILLLQQPGDPPPASNNVSYPINIYDTREGNMRDVNDGNCNVGGVVNLVEIDVKNLRSWLQAHPNVQSQNAGYLLYFSDRRGMLANPATGIKTGAYGFEDVINESDPNGTPNNQLDPGEDVDGDGVLEIYGGMTAAGDGTNLGLGVHFQGTALGTAMPPNTPVWKTVGAGTACSAARKNWVSGARHGLRLINGSLGNLPLRTAASPDPNNTGSFTVASENPVYVIGNYNANDAGFGNPHASAAVIADAVTLLSRSWNDKNSFDYPTSPGISNPPALPGRPAKSSNFRLAVCAGKNQNFSRASVAGAPTSDFGTDGGMHNFLRLLGNWSGQALGYRGSLVSLYYSNYATGVFKCCQTVYSAPIRNFSFDTDFQNFALLPPGTPNFEDVVNVGFRQIFDRR